MIDLELKKTMRGSKLAILILKIMINFPILLSTRIKNSNLKETDFHFHIERVQSRSTNTETFDTTVELKSLI